MDPQADVQTTLTQMWQLLQTPFWKHADFWISNVIGVAAAVISFLAYKQAEQAKQEAAKAKQAAVEAGKTVKLQTVCIELTEIAQRLGGVYPGIEFEEAKDLFNDTSGHLLRVMAPFADQTDLRDAISAVKAAIQAAQTSLKQVVPTDPAKEGEAPYAVYNAVEDKFATIKFGVSELTGLMEKQTYEFGREDGGD